MSELFINRTSELAVLKKWMKSDENSSKVLIIRAPTGIGKTELVTKVLKSCDIPIADIKVVDHPDFVADEGDYLLRMFRSLVLQSKKDERILDFQTFLALRTGRNTLLGIAEITAKKIATYLGKKYLGEDGVKAITDALSNDIKNFRQLGDEGQPECVKDEVVSYFSAVFSTSVCMLRIENIQKIDRASLEYIKSSFRQFNGLKGIFEYTLDSKGTLTCENLQAILSSDGIECKIFDLTPIPVAELINGLKDRPDVFRSALTQHYQSQGFNLRVIIDVNVLTSYSEDESKENLDTTDISSTSKVIRILPNNQKLLIALLVLHGAEVDINVIGAALANHQDSIHNIPNFFNFRNDIEKLRSLNYLRLEDQIVSIAHDSVTTSFLNDPINKKFMLIASVIWQDFYSSVLQNDDPFLKMDALHWLPVLYFENGKIEQAVHMLEQHGRLALKSFAPKKLVKIFQHIRDLTIRMPSALEASRLDALIEQQATVLFSSCLLDEACDCFELTDNLSIVGQLTYADACVGTERFETGVSLLNKIEKGASADTPKNRLVKLLANLVRVHALRTDGKLEQAEQLYRSLLEYEEFHNHRVFASLLRCVDIGLYKDKDGHECIDLLMQSVIQCQQYGMLADEAAARLALCQHFGYQGDFIRARKELAAADTLSAKVWIERYSILNNEAVLDIFSGTPENSYAMLNKALLLATEDGDRLLILCNCLAIGDQSVADELEYLINEISDISDELLKIAYYNLSVFYEKRQDMTQAEYYRDLAVDLEEVMDLEFWACALRGQVPTSEAIKARFSIKYYLVFIVHWNLSSASFQSILDETF